MDFSFIFTSLPHINNFNINTKQTHFKLTLNEIKYINKDTNEKFVLVITQSLHLIMISLFFNSLSSLHAVVPPSQPNVVLSSVSARFVNFVNLHSSHINCHFHCVCQYDIFIFATATHMVTAAQCHPVSKFCAYSTSARRQGCYFGPFTTIFRSSSTNS